MTVRELIAKLQAHDPFQEVMVLDGPNGGGVPRDLNLGPVQRRLTAQDEENTADVEGRAGEVVVVLGCGCY